MDEAQKCVAELDVDEVKKKNQIYSQKICLTKKSIKDVYRRMAESPTLSSS